MIIYLTSAILTPFLGLLTDKYGKKVKIMLVSYIFLILGHSFFAFLPNYS